MNELKKIYDRIEKEYDFRKHPSNMFFCPYCGHDLSDSVTNESMLNGILEDIKTGESGMSYEDNESAIISCDTEHPHDMHDIIREGIPFKCDKCGDEFYSEDGLVENVLSNSAASIPLYFKYNRNSPTKAKSQRPDAYTDSEKYLENKYFKILSDKGISAERQVKVKHGIIDILSDDCIYEVKKDPSLSVLHMAYGQLKHYQQDYPDRRLAIVANSFPGGYVNGEVELILVE